ncbi:MAG: hypothetical protein E6Q61_03550 [Nitrosomonas sp.]|nr:MAG: hypothetical protein E6Q61_03550 [Nitrosomonas sp.]
MQYFDIFNGDADGICALIQLRLVNPVESQLITGVKRDIALLQKVEASSGDQITVLDISLDRNRSDLDRLISVGAHITYFDHHYAGQIPQSSYLNTVIDESPDTCTSLLVDRYLNRQYSLWAITAAFGDNLVQIAEQRCVMAHLNSIDTQKLHQLGELINYNGYGTQIDDLHFHPARLYQALKQFQDPREAYDEAPEIATLVTGYTEDMEHAKMMIAEIATSTAAVYRLPDTAWARRAVGVWANDLSQDFPARAHLIICPDGENSYTVSVRAAKDHPYGASAFCRRYPGGGGREAAAGINKLPESSLGELIQTFALAFK